MAHILIVEVIEEEGVLSSPFLPVIPADLSHATVHREGIEEGISCHCRKVQFVAHAAITEQ